VKWELRVEEPILPIDLFFNRTVLASICGTFVIGALLFVIEVYLPLYVQGVLGGSALQSGVQLTPLLVSWSISVIVAAKAVVAFGFRIASTVGSILVTLGLGVIVLGTFDAGSTDRCFLVGMALVGVGMGPLSLSFILAVQNAVPWNRRGVATGAISYFRTMGGSLIVALFGAMLAAQLVRELPARIDVAAALRPESHERLPVEDLALVRTALKHSLRDIFIGSWVVASLCLICSLNLPQTSAPTHPSRVDPSKHSEAAESDAGAAMASLE
jgi:hypothetical protein